MHMATARTLDQPGAMAGAALSRDADAKRQRTDSYDARSDPLAAADDDTDDLQRLRTSGLSRMLAELGQEEAQPVQNPSSARGTPLYEQFMRARAAAPRGTPVKLCFHGTRRQNIQAILDHGLDPARRRALARRCDLLARARVVCMLRAARRTYNDVHPGRGGRIKVKTGRCGHGRRALVGGSDFLFPLESYHAPAHTW